MDSNNVIQITSDLDSLNKDLYNWSLLPYHLRKISDDNCLKLYGCKNRELYNKLKERILFNKPFDNDLLVQNNNTIQEAFDYSTIDRKDLIMRIATAKSMNNDYTIAILYPYDPELMSDPKYKEDYKEEFVSIYSKFIRLSDKYQKYSNLYSIDLFGCNVRSMYQLIVSDLSDDDNTKALFTRDYVDYTASALEESVTDKMIDKNIVEMFKFEIMHCRDSINEGVTEGPSLNSLLNKVSQCIYTENYSEALSSAVPYFTLDECDKFNVDSRYNINKINDSTEYYRTIIELYDKFIASGKKDTIIENSLLSLAWNPYVDPRKHMKDARERQAKWFNENGCRIIDISDYSSDVSNKTLFESSMQMNNLYNKLGLYPVYITLSFTNTVFGNIIRRVKHSTFTHCGLALDSDLRNIYTFKFTDLNHDGFMIESLEEYLTIYKDARISILCTFVDSKTMGKLEDNLKYFINNQAKTKYDFKNLINVLRNKAKDNDPYNLSMICSQFVHTMLNLAGINIIDKPSNIVIPQDFENLKHPRIYKLYNGLGKKYNELVIEDKIEKLLTTSNSEDIMYQNFVESLYYNPNSLELLTKRYNIVDNNDANKILQEMYRTISPIVED